MKLVSEKMSRSEDDTCEITSGIASHEPTFLTNVRKRDVLDHTRQCGDVHLSNQTLQVDVANFWRSQDAPAACCTETASGELEPTLSAGRKMSDRKKNGGVSVLVSMASRDELQSHEVTEMR